MVNANSDDGQLTAQYHRRILLLFFVGLQDVPQVATLLSWLIFSRLGELSPWPLPSSSSMADPTTPNEFWKDLAAIVIAGMIQLSGHNTLQITAAGQAALKSSEIQEVISSYSELFELVRG